MPYNVNKTILQFGELVFTSSFMGANETVTFKGDVTGYEFNHGGFYGGDEPLFDVGSLDIDVNMKIPRKNRERFRKHVFGELKGVKKLWAIDDAGNLVYTNARINSYSRSYTRADTRSIELSIRFDLMDGYWTKADPKKVFIEEAYMTCFDRNWDCNECFDKKECPSAGFECQRGCNDCKKRPKVCIDCGGGTCCDRYSDLQTLCELLGECDFEQYLKNCKQPVRLLYSCSEKIKRYGHWSGYGKEIRTNGNCLAKEVICVSTSTPITDITVRLVGCWEDPVVTFGGQTFSIAGKYDGTITIRPNGDVTFSCSRIFDTIDPENILSKTTTEQTPYFKLNNGKTLVTAKGSCDNGAMFVDYEEIA